MHTKKQIDGKNACGVSQTPSAHILRFRKDSLRLAIGVHALLFLEIIGIRVLRLALELKETCTEFDLLLEFIAALL